MKDTNFNRLVGAIILSLLLGLSVIASSCASNKWGQCPTYGKAPKHNQVHG